MAGLTVMDESVAELTVREVEPETRPKAALIVDLPEARAWAFPGDTIEATDGVPELHTTSRLRSWVELSEKRPVAK